MLSPLTIYMYIALSSNRLAFSLLSKLRELCGILIPHTEKYSTSDLQFELKVYSASLSTRSILPKLVVSKYVHNHGSKSF